MLYRPIKRPPFFVALQKVSSSKPYPVTNYVAYINFSIAHGNYLAAVTKIVKPSYFYEAVRDIKSRESMTKVNEALELNNTCVIEDLPPNKKLTNYKWVYNYNYDEMV